MSYYVNKNYFLLWNRRGQLWKMLTGEPSRCITNQPGQLSLISLPVR